MTQEKIATFYGTLTTLVADFAKELDVSHTDALIEILDDLVAGDVQVENDQPNGDLLTHLQTFIAEAPLADLDRFDRRKALQLATLQAQKSDQTQTNHQLTPDGIGFLLGDVILKTSQIAAPTVMDLTVGTGNLLQTVYEILARGERTANLAGWDNDDTQLALAAVSDAVIHGASKAVFTQADVVNEVIESADIVLADVPVGFYPLTPAQDYATRNPEGKSLVHQLLIEKAVAILNEDGWAYLLVPATLLSDEFAPNLIKWLGNEARLRAFLTLPAAFFKNEKAAKAILVLQKGTQPGREVLIGQYPSLKDPENLKKFLQEIAEWAKIEE